MLLRVLCLTLCLSCAYSQIASIRIRQGEVKGRPVTVENREVFAYLGIPYARAPVDVRRFKPPEPHPGWDEPFQAVEFGPACPQPLKPGLPISEDCLTINIWTPADRRYRQFPVIVVLEGELFLTSDPSRFPGQDLAVYDLIVVTLNYRVNAFGFISWEDEIMPGNLGLMDQQMALQWIIENIEMFGGDIRSITLLGHSAGAASAAFHLTSERSRGFFQRVILLSGSSLAPWAVNRRPKIATASLARELGCNFNTSSRDVSLYMLRCLQRRDLTLLDIVNRVEKMVESGNPYNMFAPIYDGHLSRERRFVGAEGPLRRLESVPTLHPVLIGVSQLDGSVMLYIKREINYMSYSYLTRYGKEVLIPLINMMSGYEGSGLSLLNHLIDFTYLQRASGGEKNNLIQSIVQMFTDSFFTAPVIRMAETLARNGLDLHFFVNDFVSPDIYKSPSNLTGALHGSDIVFLFGPAAYTRIFRQPLTYDQAKLSETLKKMVYSFAVRGEPTLVGASFPPLPRWEKYNLRDPVYALLYTGQLHRGFKLHDLAFWNFLLPDLARISNSLRPEVTPPTYFPTEFTYPTYPFPPSTESPIVGSPEETSYQSAVWVLVAVVLLMIISITTFIICARRRQRLSSATLNVP